MSATMRGAARVVRHRHGGAVTRPAVPATSRRPPLAQLGDFRTQIAANRPSLSACLTGAEIIAQPEEDEGECSSENELERRDE